MKYIPLLLLLFTFSNFYAKAQEKEPFYYKELIFSKECFIAVVDRMEYFEYTLQNCMMIGERSRKVEDEMVTFIKKQKTHIIKLRQRVTYLENQLNKK